jgi:hypothetical protein
LGDQPALLEVQQSADRRGLGGDRAVRLGYRLQDPERLALAPLEDATHLDVLTRAQLAEIADGRLQDDRRDPLGEQLGLAHARGLQQCPAGMLRVLEIHALIEVPQAVGLVSADGHRDGKRLAHCVPFSH